MEKFIQYLLSPHLGLIEIIATNKAIISVNYVKKELLPIKKNALTQACTKQLGEFLNEERKKFTLELEFSGTQFQMKVWKALLKIPFAETRSYSDIATQISHTKAVRAVGNTNRINPISIIIPCHRVIGKNNTLTGYNGGLDKKLWLLKHEKNQLL